MRKGFLIMLAVVLVAALAAPAVAGTDINGFYRAKPTLSNFRGYLGGAYTGSFVPVKDAPANAYVEQRFRVKFTSGEENVKAVFFVETDDVWGDSAGGSRNTGGGLGADAASLELKNGFVWFKLPNTPVDITVGLQNQSDSYAGLFFGAADMGGIFVNANLAPVALRLGWSKWNENALAKADDRTLYLAEAKFSPVKEVKIGANLYVIQNDQGRPTGTIQRVYMPGVDATFGAGPATINAFAFYQFGKFTDFQDSRDDVDINGFAADVRADLNAGPGKAFVEALYISGGDENGSAPGQKFKSIIDSGYTNSFFCRTDMSILLLNADDIGTAAGVYASAPGDKSMGNAGRGMTHVAAGFTMKFNDKLSGKVGAGYLMATKKLKTDPDFRKKNMGTEVNANVSYNIMKGLDVGVVGAYAWIGDFFKTSAGDAGDPDNAYDLHARVNYAF